MKRLMSILLMLNILSVVMAFDKYAGEIYEIPLGVRNIALGGTGLTDVNSYSPAFWNAALLPELTDSKIELMHANEFAGLFKYDSFSFYYHAQNSVAISLTRIAINDIPLTKLENNDLPLSNSNRPYAYKHVNNDDYLLNIALGRKLTDKLNIGVTPKLTYRNLADETAWALGADLGILYKINDKFIFASKVTNVVATHILWKDGDYETASPKGEVELRYGFSLFEKRVPINLTLRSEIYMFADQDIGEYDLSFTSISNHYGIEVTPYENISVLAGYDVDSITAGLDLSYRGFSIFYAFKNNSNNDLGNSQKLSMGYRF